MYKRVWSICQRVIAIVIVALFVFVPLLELNGSLTAEAKRHSSYSSSKSSSRSSSRSSSSSSKSKTEQLADLKRDYENAAQRGDKAAMAAAHEAANRLRAEGADEKAANRAVYGREEGHYSGWKPSSSSSGHSSGASTSSGSSNGSLYTSNGLGINNSMDVDLSKNGYSAFKDKNEIDQLISNNQRLKDSLEKTAGKLVFGYGDQTARLGQTIDKASIAQILARNYGIEYHDVSGKEAMDKLGLSGNVDDKVSADELSRVINNLEKTRGSQRQFDLQIIQDAKTGKLSDGNLTRGEAILLAERSGSTHSHDDSSSGYFSDPYVPPTSTPTSNRSDVPASLPPDLRNLTARCDSYAIAGIPLGVYVDVASPQVQVATLKVVSSSGMEARMETGDGQHFRGQLPVLKNAKTGPMNIQVIADLLQSPYGAKHVEQTLRVFVKSSTPDMKDDVPADDGAPDWWTPPQYGGPSN